MIARFKTTDIRYLCFTDVMEIRAGLDGAQKLLGYRLIRSCLMRAPRAMITFTS